MAQAILPKAASSFCVKPRAKPTRKLEIFLLLLLYLLLLLAAVAAAAAILNYTHCA